MKRNFLRNIFKGLSFTTVFFIFQACYGIDPGYKNDTLIEGLVKSKTSGDPLKGIKVTFDQNSQYIYTDEDGKFSLYTMISDSCRIKFEDVDASQNGEFIAADTIINLTEEPIFLEIELKNK